MSLKKRHGSLANKLLFFLFFFIVDERHRFAVFALLQHHVEANRGDFSLFLLQHFVDVDAEEFYVEISMQVVNFRGL